MFSGSKRFVKSELLVIKLRVQDRRSVSEPRKGLVSYLFSMAHGRATQPQSTSVEVEKQTRPNAQEKK